MSRRSMKVKIEEYLVRKAEDRREREILENSKEYQPEVEEFINDNS